VDLRGRVALVTGASRGIGRAIAIALAERGCNVGINFKASYERAREVLEAVKSRGVQGILLQADVSDYNQVKSMVDELIERFGRIDILVNNAGIFTPARSIEEITDEEWDMVMNVNLRGVFYCCKAVVPYMIRQGGGKIVNISSTAGRGGGRASSIPYAASKAGVIGLTYVLAYQLAKYNILVNAVVPGQIETDMLREQVPKELLEIQKRETPLGRFGRPEDVAHAVVFLAENDYVTAEVINVCGGRIPG